MGTKFSELPEASSVAADDYIAVLDCSENILKNFRAWEDVFKLLPITKQRT